MAIKLGNRPETFAQRTVTFPMPDGTTGKIKYKGVYRTRTDFGEMLDQMNADKEDGPAVDEKTRWEQLFSQGSESNGRFLVAAIKTWDAEIELDVESLTQFSDELPGGAAALLEDYRQICLNGRLGN
ncbi:phage tail assembly chaperone [Comamonas sp. JUb58]|uniref:phage tail assembly chaperone n=1 Tax=Comamonas sp. JUb58 TaxID=2485114 RepID=UPI0010D5D0AD|nr:phage tail assembly chaperone [Comamonas sp. JUb58]TDS68147.1 tail assembly chaperone [Comamonas sp. JUb58]